MQDAVRAAPPSMAVMLQETLCTILDGEKLKAAIDVLLAAPPRVAEAVVAAYPKAVRIPAEAAPTIATAPPSKPVPAAVSEDATSPSAPAVVSKMTSAEKSATAPESLPAGNPPASVSAGRLQEVLGAVLDANLVADTIQALLAARPQISEAVIASYSQAGLATTATAASPQAPTLVTESAPTSAEAADPPAPVAQSTPAAEETSTEAQKVVPAVSSPAASVSAIQLKEVLSTILEGTKLDAAIEALSVAPPRVAEAVIAAYATAAASPAVESGPISVPAPVS